MAAPNSDLPDPLKDQTPPASLSTDELLAKMAADEIDQLLDEANPDRESSAEAAAQAVMPQVAGRNRLRAMRPNWTKRRRGSLTR